MGTRTDEVAVTNGEPPTTPYFDPHCILTTGCNTPDEGLDLVVLSPAE